MAIPTQVASSLMAVPVGMRSSIFAQMYQNNPQFREFADSLNGKTPQQAFQENGYDISQIPQGLF